MRRPSSFLAVAVVVLGALASASCAPETEAPAESASPSDPPAELATTSLAELVPYGNEPWSGIVTGGQPSAEDFAALQAAGLRSVINLRVPSERGTRDEPQWIEELGLDYVSIPVDGKAGLTLEAAQRLDEALATAERPVLVHCGSSNRVGAVFALRAFHLGGENAEAALEIGRAAGVTKLEGTVEKLLAEAAGE